MLSLRLGNPVCFFLLQTKDLLNSSNKTNLYMSSSFVLFSNKYFVTVEQSVVKKSFTDILAKLFLWIILKF